MSQLTLGSLFDGSGGFPLAGYHVGIKPVWASEIEPFPIRVTTNRLPEMKHLGDITKINGAEIEPVDVITAGFPCTDLSVSGARKGLEGTRSGLFYDAVRIVAEMRKATDNKYPRYVVFENVPGMLTCSGGDDFNEVISQLTSLGGQRNQLSRPTKWYGAGAVVGDDFDFAWRILDAQFFKCAQSRRRVFIVFCFGPYGGGGQAQRILFERKVLEGNPSESNQEGALLANSVGGDSAADNTGTGDGCVAIPVEYNPNDSRIKFRKNDTIQTLTARMGTGGNTTPLVLDGVPIALSRADFFTIPLWNLAYPLVATDFKGPQIVLQYDSSMGGAHRPF